MNYSCPKCQTPTNSRNDYCKPCRKLYDAQRYIEDSGIGKTHSKSYYRRKQQIVIAKKSQPCSDCNQTLPWFAMDFDHTDSSIKVRAVSRLLASGSVEKLLLEIEKCEVVCSNCHRLRTHRRKCVDNNCNFCS